ANPDQPPPHTERFPDFSLGETPEEVRDGLARGPEFRRGIPARDLLEQRRRLDDALDRLAPQDPERIDAFVVAIALDSDPVFAREAREAGQVLARRYDAAERTLVLAGPDGTRDDLAHGSIEVLFVALARIAETLDPAEDVLVLYTTSHGLKEGLAYHYGNSGYGVLSPERLRDVLGELQIARRIVIVNACYSGVFVPALSSADTAILTAAASERSSFGCEAENDWTFFGDALINRALRKPQPLADAAREAGMTIARWESDRMLLASLPQVAIGQGAQRWLAALDARAPRLAGNPVGRPAIGD
ncbi:MAG: C13 family peptidase, partial [Erythrobacter sp.]